MLPCCMALSSLETKAFAQRKASLAIPGFDLFLPKGRPLGTRRLASKMGSYIDDDVHQAKLHDKQSAFLVFRNGAIPPKHDIPSLSLEGAT